MEHTVRTWIIERWTRLTTLLAFDDERGASLVEYALLVGLIAVVCIGAVSFLGGTASSKFSSIGSSLQ